MMKTPVLYLTLILVLVGCAGRQPSANRLVESVTVGILADSRVSHWKALLAKGEVRAHTVHYFDQETLMRELAAGNIDLAIGLPLTDALLEQRLWSTKPFEKRLFYFLTRKNDPLRLERYHLFANFTKRAKRVGFISEGEQGVVNRLVIAQSRYPQVFSGCGSQEACLAALEQGDINVLFVDQKLLLQHLSLESFEHSPFQVTRFEHEQAFSFLVNQRTLANSEFSKIKKLIH